jgi:hypothetical protein
MRSQTEHGLFLIPFSSGSFFRRWNNKARPHVPGQMDAAALAEDDDRQAIDRMRVPGIRLPRFLGMEMVLRGLVLLGEEKSSCASGAVSGACVLISNIV